MEMLSFTKEDMEENYDATKTAVIRSLMAEGYLDPDEAEEWCRTHTIILRKKTIFRTLSNLWKETEPTKNGHYLLVVKIPDVVERDEDEGEKEPLPLDNSKKVIKLKG